MPFKRVGQVRNSSHDVSPSREKHLKFGNCTTFLHYVYISPHSENLPVSHFICRTGQRVHAPTILTTNLGLLFCPVGTFSIFRSVNMPSMTFPKTTCFPSRNSHCAVVMKNYLMSIAVRKRKKVVYLAAVCIRARVRLFRASERWNRCITRCGPSKVSQDQNAFR
jgi:hypothetical protein